MYKSTDCYNFILPCYINNRVGMKKCITIFLCDLRKVSIPRIISYFNLACYLLLYKACSPINVLFLGNSMWITFYAQSYRDRLVVVYVRGLPWCWESRTISWSSPDLRRVRHRCGWRGCHRIKRPTIFFLSIRSRRSSAHTFYYCNLWIIKWVKIS